MSNITHECEDNSQIFLIDMIAAFDALADQPQNFKTAVDHLMLTCARCCCLHAKPPRLKAAT